MSELLKSLKVDCEKVITNLVNTKCDDAWSIIKLNNMIQDIDDHLGGDCMNCHGDKVIIDVDNNEWPCLECKPKPTIADYLASRKEMLDKTGAHMVTVKSLVDFMEKGNEKDSAN